MHSRIAAATLAVCVSLAVDAFAQTKPATSTQTAQGGASQPAAPAPSTPATAGISGTSGTTAAGGAKGTTGTQPLTTVGQPVPVDRAPSGTSRDPKIAAHDVKPPASAPDPRGLDMSAFQIGPEDLLDISVWKNVELSRVVPVRPDGKVSLPLVNDIQAAGLTPTELRDQITTKLAEFIPAPEVSVMVREVHSRKVAVVGAVKMPGRYEMRSPMTVLEVIALAQGLTDFAARDRIFILRDVNGKSTQIPFNYRKVGDDQKNFYLRAGDVVVVP